ncbi:universal stress protein [Lacticaseibacillus hulanensis]|jgi:nucleotide-binding universal stress UspA family protein|uniref:universal stress protein n=1 Tax=Lacticaseibacillus hulanensis TaxID=2493111 RepID=UPI000FD9E3ED|nr:universal stress protein [Lacticaseibacillus hulanensis]
MTDTPIKPKPDYTNILVGVDRDDDAQKAFAYALRRAVRDDARLTIVSVLETSSFNIYESMSKGHIERERMELQHQISSYVQMAKDAGVEHVHSIIGEGDPDDVILEDVIPRVKPDLLIIGAETKQGLSRHFGSHANKMAKYAPISVMIVR